ncbi:MAG: urea transporter/murein DD-endopeptidase MepM/ murein hydrolase activator NlpD [Granulosicoccus sp.]
MSERVKHTAAFFWESLLHSYSQIFFSLDKVFAVVLLITSFIDPHVGISALVSGLIAIGVGKGMGFDEKLLREGMYSFNSLMVGMVMAVYYDLSIPFLVMLIFISVLTLFITVAFIGKFSKYGLPIMSVPFLFGVWIVLLVGREFEGLNLTERGIYTINELWWWGGETLVNAYQYIDTLPLPTILDVYLRSLGAIFFQYNLLAGMIILFGLIRFSRIAFVLSLVGFFSGYLFYGFMEGQFSHLHYSYIGFNFILSAIALGGFFIIPSTGSFILVALASPIIAILIASVGNLFEVVQLPIYSLPYNILVLLTLYVLKFRTVPKGLNHVTDQTYSPERNLYKFLNRKDRFENESIFHIYLPVFGEWTISQGHDGDITHKGDWKEAFDLVIEDEKGKTYREPGSRLEDYYCYNRPVSAPQAGYVVTVEDDVEENMVGDVNLERNWGNTVVLRHGDYLFTKISHLKKGTIKVEVGDYVKKGQVLGDVGNSGRSPEPHIHFQIQSTPYVGSKTLEYPIAYYLEHAKDGLKFHAFDYPKENQVISNISVNELMKKAFGMIPGLSLNIKSDDVDLQWEVFTNAYNHTYIYCHETKAIAYFVNNGTLVYFTEFYGDRSTLLYKFFLCHYKVLLGYYKGVEVEDKLPVDAIYKGLKKSLLDFASPFYPVVEANYSMQFTGIDDGIQPTWIKFTTDLDVTALGSQVSAIQCETEVGESGISAFTIYEKGTATKYECEVL